MWHQKRGLGGERTQEKTGGREGGIGGFSSVTREDDDSFPDLS